MPSGHGPAEQSSWQNVGFIIGAAQMSVALPLLGSGQSLASSQ
jgi:hypothetical protein